MAKHSEDHIPGPGCGLIQIGVGGHGVLDEILLDSIQDEVGLVTVIFFNS